MAGKGKNKAVEIQDSAVKQACVTRSGRRKCTGSISALPDDDFMDQSGYTIILNRIGAKNKPADDCDAQIDDSDGSGEDDGEYVAGYPTVGNRTCPQLLVDAIVDMSGCQKNVVIDVGFGSILKMKGKKVPAVMAYWVFDNFDLRICELKLNNGRSLHLESTDASLMFGLPKGKHCIDRKAKRKDCSFLVEWRGLFSNKGRIKLTEVKTKMLDEVNGGVWFKRHFMVLLMDMSRKMKVEKNLM